MSQENVDRIRRGPEALRGGEWSAVSSEDLDAIVTDAFHPDVEWHDQRELPGATVHHGTEEVERQRGPSVVAVYQIHARGRSSGVVVQRDAAWVYTFRGAKIEFLEIFGTRREALEAVGLRE